MQRGKGWLAVLVIFFGFSIGPGKNSAFQTPKAETKKISIAFGQRQSGTLTEGESNSFAFAAAAGDRIIARISRSSGLLEDRMELLGPDEKKLAESLSEGSADLISDALPNAGTYTIRVSYASGPGQGGYNLTLERLNGGSGRSISFGQTVSDKIGLGDLRTFTFSGTSADRIVLRVIKTSDALNPEIRVYDPNGTQLSEAWSAAGTELASDALPSTGIYTILVCDHWGTNVGGFNLTLERLFPGGGTPISYGQRVSGVLAAGDLDAYTITAAAGSMIRVKVSQTAKTGIFYPQIRLYSPTGLKLQEEWASSSIEFRTDALPSAGSYMLLISDYYGIYSGEYSLVIERL